MDGITVKHTKWFWPWQDEQEEAWLESMSQKGWHLNAVRLPGQYYFSQGEPLSYTYRLDYIIANKAQFEEYLQVFNDAGWEYLGEMSNWRYWRKASLPGEQAEIFTDRESKVKKYQRLLVFMGFFLVLLVFLGSNMFKGAAWAESSQATWISAIYLVGMLAYAVLIPIYIVVVVKLLLRIQQLKRKSL